jgi:hypothetical protein
VGYDNNIKMRRLKLGFKKQLVKNRLFSTTGMTVSGAGAGVYVGHQRTKTAATEINKTKNIVVHGSVGAIIGFGAGMFCPAAIVLAGIYLVSENF